MVADCSDANSSLDSLSLSFLFFFFNLLKVFNVIGEGN